MGVERRRNGRTYLYRKERGGDGRVRSVYVCPVPDGAGLLEDLAFEAAHAAREEARRRAVFAPVDAALSLLRADEARLRACRNAYLLATGHHSHKGTWRRRRTSRRLPPFTLASTPAGRPDPMPKKKSRATASTITPRSSMSIGCGVVFTLPDDTPAPLLEEIAEASTAAGKPGATWQDLSHLRDVLALLPAEAFRPLASSVARRSVAGLVVGVDTAKPPEEGSSLAVVLAEAEMDRRAGALTEDADGALTRSAVRHLAVAESLLDVVTDGYARHVRGSYRASNAEHWERRLSAAQTRHVRALATVAKLRAVEREERRRMDRHAREHVPSAAAPAPVLPPYAGDGLPATADVELATS